VPNVFFSGSAKLVVDDADDVQYIERDPVGGENQLGNFTLWDEQVTYGKDDIVKGSNDNFYQSFAAGNQGNDPISVSTAWFQVKFLGVWNTAKTYATGDVVQTTDGSVWKSLIDSNLSNNPSSDDGTKWLPAIDSGKIPQIIALTWINKTADFTVVSGESYQIDGSANTVDATLPTLVIGDSFTFHAVIGSTFKIQILNPSYTINGPSGVIAAATDLELVAGDSVQLVAKTTSILEIVGAQT
jgi:hypothetical protein